MSFFNAEQPDKKGPTEFFGVSDASRPNETALFQASPGGESESHLSLSAYISQHLQNDSPAQPEAPPLPAPRSFVIGAQPSAYQTELSRQRQGQVLNQLDVEFTAGLEQYMPTRLFRLRVTKKRLSIEIADLKLRLNKYERLVSTDMAVDKQDMEARMAHVRERIQLLEAHEIEVNRELQAMMTCGPVFYGMAQGTRNLRTSLNEALRTVGLAVKRLIVGKTRMEMEARGLELLNLQDVLQERLRDKNTAPGEISQLINQYEQAIREMEALGERLNKKTALRQLLR